MNSTRFVFVLSCIGLFSAVQAVDSAALIEHVKNSIQNAENGHSKLTSDILALRGLSTARVRHFLNNLCTLPNASYLEIGVWRGSTFISALYQNTQNLSHAVAVDNWSDQFFSQYEGVDARIDFIANTSQYLPQNSFVLYDQNSFTIEVKNISNRPIDIYFYDGNHSEEAQRRAFTYFNDAFADTFIAVVDDWNYKTVQVGTQKAFKELGYIVLFERVLAAPPLARIEEIDFTMDTWWNGLYVAVIQKQR